MANPVALAVIGAAFNLRHTHPSAPPLGMLDLVMKGRQGQTLDFVGARARHASLADPSSEFGQIVARALDQGVTAAEWATFTGDKADPVLRAACLDVWRGEIFGARSCGRYGVTMQGLP